MGSKTSTRSGRVTFDDRGCAVWEWRTDAEQFTRDIDTSRLKALQDDDSLQMVLTGEHLKPQAGCDPYNNLSDTSVLGTRKAKISPPEKRKSLDDMRRLSEQIKRMRG